MVAGVATRRKSGMPSVPAWESRMNKYANSGGAVIVWDIWEHVVAAGLLCTGTMLSSRVACRRMVNLYTSTHALSAL